MFFFFLLFIWIVVLCSFINFLIKERLILEFCWLNKFLFNRFLKWIKREVFLFLEIFIFWFCILIVILCLFLWMKSVIILFCGVYLKVLESRLKIIFFNLFVFIYSFKEGILFLNIKLIWCFLVSDLKLFMIWCIKGIIFICFICNFILFFCILWKLRIWFIKWSIWLVLCFIICNCLCILFGKVLFFRIYFIGFVINVSGVWSLWEIFVKKWSFILEICCFIDILCFRW